MMMKKSIILLVVFTIISCKDQPDRSSDMPWEKHGKLIVKDNSNLIEYEDGTPFLWIGGTVWGMSEWLTREDIDYYLDDRKKKGINIVQICLLWGKRRDNPVVFNPNEPNAYGHRALKYTDTVPDPSKPDIKKGGSAYNPNDYWDHAEYIISEAARRGMYIALLPVWGRRYVNATHQKFGVPLFDTINASIFGEFLGNRYKNYPNIIWVMGGDVGALAGGDYRHVYRKMAEGICSGITNLEVHWNQHSVAWDQVLMTYHPDGNPHSNSSTWFHSETWLDFNMIETFMYRDELYAAVLHDYNLENPVKPTVMGEPNYEGYTDDKLCSGLNIRHQAYQTFFAGGVGFTYGGHHDSLNHGPLFSPFNNWKSMLDMDGALSLPYLRLFLENNNWHHWKPDTTVVIKNAGKGENQKVATTIENTHLFVYFPDTSSGTILIPHANLVEEGKLTWFNPKNGEYVTQPDQRLMQEITVSVPQGFEDGVLVIKTK